MQRTGAHPGCRRDVVAGAQPGDVVLVMSNGGFGGIQAKLLAALEATR